MADAIWTVNSIVLTFCSLQTARMNKLSTLLITLTCLAACGPVSLYYKPGGSVSRLKTDLLACEVDALDKAPVANQIRQFPPYYVPARSYCRSGGDCYVRGGFFAPGEIYSVDVNARLRNDVETQCMAGKGYSPVALQRCTSSTVSKAASDPTAVSQRMPPLSETSCVARDTAGDWQIIDPNG